MGEGTCFEAALGSTSVLVTNWHVITGTNPMTGEQRSQYLPDTIWVDFHSDDVEVAATHRYPLYDDVGQANWMVHPTLGNNVDIAVLRFAIGGEWGVYPGRTVHMEAFRLDEERRQIQIEPTTDVSVIGYPFGQRSAGTLGIWSRGTIATEPELQYQGEPLFLIDCRSRPGQSGSPVIAYRPAHTLTPIVGHGSVVMGGPIWDLLGVYSGRINEESDLGRVWKSYLIREIIDGNTRDTFTFF